MDILRKLPRDLQGEILSIHKQNYDNSDKYVVEAEFNARVSLWADNDPYLLSKTKVEQIPFMQVLFDSGTGKWYNPGRLARVSLMTYKTSFIDVGFGEISPRRIKGMMRRCMETKYYKSLINTLNSKEYKTMYTMTINVRKVVDKDSIHKDETSWYNFATEWQSFSSITQETATRMWGELRSRLERGMPPCAF